jgi:hypothetical protein
MKAVTEGHLYRLENFEGNSYQEISFIHKVPVSRPDAEEGELETVANGTTNEEVIDMLIDRIKYLDDKFPCYENKAAISHLNCAVGQLIGRTQDRIERKVKGKHLK